MLESLLPPEIVSGIIYGGPGEGSLVSAASSWAALASEIESSALLTKATMAEIEMAWSGPSSMTSLSSLAQYVSSLQELAAYAQQMSVHATAAAGNFTAVRASVVPPPVIAANRIQLATLVATNFLGVNTAAIAATEAAYMAMWAQDSAAMIAYGAAMATTLAAMPVTPATTKGPSPATVTPRQVGLTGGDVPTWLTQGVLGALLGQPQTGAVETWGAFVGNWLSSTTGLGANSNLWNTLFSSGFFMPAQYAMGDLVAMATAGSALQSRAPEEIELQVPATTPVPPQTVGGSYTPASASSGQSPRVGRLSVPPAWSLRAPMESPLPTLSRVVAPAAVGATEEAVAAMPMSGMIPMPMGMASTSSYHHSGEKKRGRWSEHDDLTYGDEVGSVISRNPAGG